MIGSLLLLLAVQGASMAPQDSAGRAPVVVTRAPLDAHASVIVHAMVVPDTLYVGQQATYELGVFVERSVRERMRRMEAVAPEMRGMLAYDPPPPRSGFAPRIVNGRRYDPHVYERAIFPLAPGHWVIPPARLVYAVPLTSSFFSREETVELRSDSVVVEVVEPPVAARPPDYSGAVGQIAIDAWIDAAAPRVGDPIGLTIRVSGSGNVKLFPRPQLAIPWADAVPAGERVNVQEHTLAVHGTKEFDWVLTPKEPGEMVLPVVRYAYFDPVAERYQVARTRALHLRVAPGLLARSDSGSTPERPARLALRAQYRGSVPVPPYRHVTFWLLLAGAPLPALVLAAARRPRRRPARAPAARLKRAAALRGGMTAEDAVRRLLVDALADRLHVPRETIAEPAALERAARRAGVSQATAAGAAALLAEMYAAAFDARGVAPGAASSGGRPRVDARSADVARRARRVYQDIDREARPGGAWPTVVARGGRIVLAVLGAAVAVHATAAAAGRDDDAARFAMGVEAYRQGSVVRAMHDFGAVVERVPRAADAWVNYGTAAWEAGDTARAVIGWQRGLRLEPTAADVRERLALVTTVNDARTARVLPVPPTFPALAAAALWLVTWSLIAWRASGRSRRAPPLRRRVVFAGLVSAVLLGGAAAELDRRLAVDRLAVVAHATPVRALPDLGTAPEGALATGDIAQMVERRGAWARVDVGVGTSGWVDASDLLSLQTPGGVE